MKYETSFKHSLIVPFEYHDKGGKIQAQEVTVFAPSNKIIPYTAIIEQEYAKGMISITQFNKGDRQEEQKAQQNETQKENTIEEIELFMTMIASGADMPKMYHTFRKILVSGTDDKPTCLIDNQQKMTEIMFESMSPKDTRILLGIYIKSFLGMPLGN